METESIALRDIADALRQTRPFAETGVDAQLGVDQVDRVTASAGTLLAEPGEPLRF